MPPIAPASCFRKKAQGLGMGAGDSGLNHLPLFAVYHVAENNSRIIVANYLLKSIKIGMIPDMYNLVC